MAEVKNGVQNGKGRANEGYEEEEEEDDDEEEKNPQGRNGKNSTSVDPTRQIDTLGTFAKKSVVSIAPSMLSDKRDEWGGGLEFLMSCIATSVGLGNIWRFPFTAYEHGGGAFLIPYIIILFLVGKPFYYLEGLLGQFSNKSIIKVWSMAPAMKGIGYSQALASFCVVSYYCSLMALTLYYMVASFQSELPWSYCRDEWKDFCIDGVSNNDKPNHTVYSSAELFFRKTVLNELDSIDNGIGWPSWKLSICLFVSWACIFGILSRGVKSSGKAAYFLAIFPYVMMITLLVRAVTLEGAVNGILFFITPKWDKLWEPTVWYAAITQCFYSLSVCFGSIIMYSSYNNFSHVVNRDVMIVTTLDTLTSLIAGCTIFGILGNLAHEMGTDDISTVVRGGTGLAFISYPDALSRFSVVPQLFAILFFIMLFVLGTGSAIALVGSVFSIVCDRFPLVRQWKIILGISIIGYLVGLVYITPGGQWFLTLVDYYGGTFNVIIVGVTEISTVFWIYGLFNFLNDIEFMSGKRPGWYWRLCWIFVTPGLMIVILVYTIAIYSPILYSGMPFPDYAYGIGWTIFVVGVSQIVGWMVYTLIKNRTSSFVETIKRSFLPSKRWGPKSSKIRREWRTFIAERKSQNKGGLFNLFCR